MATLPHTLSTCPSPPAPDPLPLAAEAFFAQWRRIEAALTPIIGTRGVTAIYARALHLAGTEYPGQRPFPTVPLTCPQALAAIFRAPEGTTEALDALLAHFHALLADLIGTTLAQRLLEAHHAPCDAAASAQDTSQ